ncbi:hypothetical protein [Kocuria rosea]|uniref:hypothetical protein n=1 Tax=Kocuria rosea TaxID=1275 RepID=UPI00119FDC85|nr:hypothetical protein [Kocuria rosea]
MAKTKKQRWCRCGHTRGNHFNLWREGVGGFDGYYEKFQCHASFCACRLFTLDSSLRSRIKRLLNAP